MADVHVHGVVPRADQTAHPRRVEHREISALISDVEPGELTAASVLRLHWRVLEEAAATATVLPVRFGTVMTGDQAVVDDFLAPRYDVLLQGLEQLAGKVQLTVKGSFHEEDLMRDVVAKSQDVARLRERVRALPADAAYYDRIRLGELVSAEVERAREHAGELVMGRLEPLAVAASREQPAGIDAAVHCAFLVERKRGDEFSRGVAKLEPELADGVRLRCIGPLPPFSFSGDGTTPGSPAWA
jgi:Gas vesicle synthesis protein GvpL/GvpF